MTQTKVHPAKETQYHQILLSLDALCLPIAVPGAIIPVEHISF
ncbi:MAG: hypothetical protein ACHQUC_03950 [Chlamydiales bacterium]